MASSFDNVGCLASWTKQTSAEMFTLEIIAFSIHGWRYISITNAAIVTQWAIVHSGSWASRKHNRCMLKY